MVLHHALQMSSEPCYIEGLQPSGSQSGALEQGLSAAPGGREELATKYKLYKKYIFK